MKTEESKNNLPAEDPKKSDVSKKPVKDKKSGQKNQFFLTTIKKIGFAFLLLLIGALVVVLSLYLPSASALKNARSELDRLMPMEAEYTSLQEDYQTASTQAGVYKILSNTSLLHIALVDNNTSRINQFIRYIEEDLNKLSVPKFSDLPTDLSTQFSKVKSHVADDRLKAIDELQDFYNDLLLLIDNLG